MFDVKMDRIRLEADNALFLNLNMQDFRGSENLFVIDEAMPLLSSAAPCQVLIVDDADSASELAKKALLEQYGSRAKGLSSKPRDLDAAFPQLSRYAQDPEKYAKQIQDKRVVFTYRRTASEVI